jgi:hypothetical protein
VKVATRTRSDDDLMVGDVGGLSAGHVIPLSPDGSGDGPFGDVGFKLPTLTLIEGGAEDEPDEQPTRLRIWLASGFEVAALVYAADLEEAGVETVEDYLEERVAATGKPRWAWVGDFFGHTQAIHGVQVL